MCGKGPEGREEMEHARMSKRLYPYPPSPCGRIRNPSQKKEGEGKKEASCSRPRICIHMERRPPEDCLREEEGNVSRSSGGKEGRRRGRTGDGRVSFKDPRELRCHCEASGRAKPLWDEKAGGRCKKIATRGLLDRRLGGEDIETFFFYLLDPCCLPLFPDATGHA